MARHNMITINIAKNEGLCSACGEVGLYYQKYADRYSCRQKRREDKTRYNDKKRFGIYTQTPRKELLEAQNGKCGICKTPFTEVTPCLDHDHVTGNIRGLLCNFCNVGLGYFKDNLEALESARKYILNPPAKY